MSGQDSDNEWKGLILNCDNHKPWNEYRDWEIMDDLHAICVRDWENPFFAVCTPNGVFCSQSCADSNREANQNTPVNPFRG